MKKIYTQEAVSEFLERGVQKVTDVVKTTLGGRGKNVVIRDINQQVHIINDGVTIAEHIHDQDPADDSGVMLAKQVANKTNRESGDGTTTSIILLNSYLKALKSESGNMKRSEVRDLREKIQNEVDRICEELDKNKTSVADSMIEKIAKISALDNDIAKTIASVFKEVGRDGSIIVDDSQKLGVSYEIVQGIEINDGYASPYLITKVEGKKAIVEDVPVLIAKKKLDDVTEMMPLLEDLAKMGKKRIAIFAKEFSDDFLTFFVVNKVQGDMNPILVATNDVDDIQVVTGAKIVSEENGVELSDKDILGLASKVVVGEYKSTVIGTTEPTEVQGLVDKLKKRLEKAESESEKYELQERIAKLTGGVAIIRITGNNEIESKEKKLKMEDAINAVRSAIDEGVIEGGGMALFRIANKFYHEKDDMVSKMMFDVLTSPVKQIIENADEEDSVYKGLFLDENGNKGYNVVTRQYEDFFQEGILDPVKVTKSALKNAVSMGNIMMTAEAAVIYVDENSNHKTRPSEN